MKPGVKEFLFLFLAATILLVLSSLPNWEGQLAQTKDLSFSGLYFDNSDYAFHIAMMQSGIQGKWLFQSRFTVEKQQPAAIRMFYIVLGHISKVLHLDPESTYHLFRWIMGYAALFSIFLLCRQIFTNRFLCWCAFCVAVMGSGLGWFQLLTGWIPGHVSPIDFWLIDAYVFFSVSLFPHFSFTIALMALGLFCYIKYFETKKWMLIAGIALASVLIQFVNPIIFAVIDVTLLIITIAYWWKARKNIFRFFLPLGLIALIQFPFFFYNFQIQRQGPVWSQFTTQNLTLSPPPEYYLWGFGFLLPFMIIGAVDAIRKRNPVLLGMVGWVVSAFGFAYLPLNFQRRFLLAVTVPLAILTIHGFDIALRFFEQKSPALKPRRMSFFILLISFVSISSILLSLGNVLKMKTRPADFFYPSVLDPAFSWLQDHVNHDDFVLSTVQSGQLIAQKAGAKVYLGHSMETYYFEEKQAIVNNAFQANLPENILSTLVVDWVFYGPYERIIAPDFHPGDNLELVYDQSGVKIYRIK
jgi:hypothetical protein